MSEPISLKDDALEEAPWSKAETALIEFWSFRCEASRLVVPAMSAAPKQMPETDVYKVNVDDCPYLAAHFNVSMVPMLLAFKSGSELARLRAHWTLDDLKALFTEQSDG